MGKILYEERYFIKPLFKKATFYTHPINNQADVYDNEVLYKSGVVVEGSSFPPAEGDLIEMMFTSSLYGVYGNVSYIVLDITEIGDRLAISAIREDSEDGVEWNFILEDTEVN